MGSINVVEACLVENYNLNGSLIQEPLTILVTLRSGSNKATHSVKDKED